MRRWMAFSLAAGALLGIQTGHAGAVPEGQVTWAAHVSLVNAHGPRLAESGLGLVTDYFYSAPYEDVRLKGK